MDSEKPEKLTSAFINFVAWDIREGVASPEDARRLLECFCNAFDDRESFPPELLHHLRDAFRAFLDGEKTIEAALGIARKKGRPKADPDIRGQMATEILRLRLDGTSHQEALAAVSERFGWGETIVADAWREYQQEAIVMIRLERSLEENFRWPPEDVQRLDEIFADKSWYLTPEKLKARGGTSEN